MTSYDLEDLEAEIKLIEGVITCALTEGSTVDTLEVRVFTAEGTSERYVRNLITDALARRDLIQHAERIFVHQLSGQDVPEPAPHTGAVATTQSRPVIRKINITSSGPTTEARVSLYLEGTESEGVGTGPGASYAMRVVAATTLEAAQAFVREQGIFALKGVALVEVLANRIVVVLVHSSLGETGLVVGAALVGTSSIEEASVKAALDAVNRHLSQALA